MASIYPQNFSSYKTKTLPPLNTASCSLSPPLCPWHPPFCFCLCGLTTLGTSRKRRNIVPRLRNMGAQTGDMLEESTQAQVEGSQPCVKGLRHRVTLPEDTASYLPCVRWGGEMAEGQLSGQAGWRANPSSSS